MFVGLVNLGFEYVNICYNVGVWFIEEFVVCYNCIFKYDFKYYGLIGKVII